MRWSKLRLLLAALAASLVVIGTGSTEAQNEPVQQTTEPAPAPACHYKTSTHRWNTQQAFRYSSAGGNYVAFKVRRQYVHQAASLRDCAKRTGDRQAYRRMLRYWHVRKTRWRLYREIDLATPYGKWAIPWPIVRCESGGSWRARNPSGAEGPYQLLGHGQPWPVRSLWDKLRHHLIARSLWINGGTSPWAASRGCWG